MSSPYSGATPAGAHAGDTQSIPVVDPQNGNYAVKISDIGSVEGGKLADLVVLDKNPLDDIKNTNTIRFVMKNGRMYDGNTLDEVYPTKRALQHFVWQDGAPQALTGTP